MRFVQKLAKAGSSIHVNIPKQICDALGWKPSQPIEIETIGDDRVQLHVLDKRTFTPRVLPPVAPTPPPAEPV